MEENNNITLSFDPNVTNEMQIENANQVAKIHNKVKRTPAIKL